MYQLCGYDGPRCSWFAIYGGMTIIFAGMFTVVMHFMSVLKNINPVIIFLLFMFFGFSIITFAFALTPFFHKPKVLFNYFIATKCNLYFDIDI